MKKNNHALLKDCILEFVWNNSTDAMFTIGYDGRLLSLNPAYTTILGWEMHDFQEENPFPFIVDFSMARLNDELALFRQGQDITYRVKKRRCKDGGIIEVVASYHVINDGEILAVGMYKVFAKQIQMERQLQLSEDRYRNLIEYLPDAIFVETNNKIVFANASAIKLVSAESVQELLNKSFFHFLQTDDLDQLKKKIFHDSFNNGSIVEKLVRLDGKIIWVEITLMFMQYEEEPVIQLVVRDVTEKRNYEAKLKFLAFHDPLTGLTNRRYFSDEMNKAIETAKCHRMQLAVIYLDIDRFKDINDSLGHNIGDILLKQFSDRLRETVRKNDILCRVGGDEFLILIDDIEHAEEIRKLVKRMHNVFQAPYQIGEEEIHTTVSMGIAVFPMDGENAKTLILRADEALYRAKVERNHFRFYSE